MADVISVTNSDSAFDASKGVTREKLTVAPWRIIVVDNEHSDKTHGMVEEFSAKLTAQWGTTVADLSGNENGPNAAGAIGFGMPSGTMKSYCQ